MRRIKHIPGEAKQSRLMPFGSSHDYVCCYSGTRMPECEVALAVLGKTAWRLLKG